MRGDVMLGQFHDVVQGLPAIVQWSVVAGLATIPIWGVGFGLIDRAASGLIVGSER